MKDAEVPNTPTLNLDIPDPKIDIHYTNGDLKGKFHFKFKQHIFNWVLSIFVSGCGAHGVYLHYHQQDLEKTIADQQKLVTEAQSQAAVALANLQQVQLLLTQKSIPTPTIGVDSQDKPKLKQ